VTYGQRVSYGVIDDTASSEHFSANIFSTGMY
jgi:hypothetical protein